MFRSFKRTCRKSLLCYLVIAGFVAFAFGSIDELTQIFLTGRSATTTDWFLDASGIVAAIGFLGIEEKYKLIKHGENKTKESK